MTLVDARVEIQQAMVLGYPITKRSYHLSEGPE